MTDRAGAVSTASEVIDGIVTAALDGITEKPTPTTNRNRPRLPFPLLVDHLLPFMTLHGGRGMCPFTSTFIEIIDQ